ncbi:2-phosphosulfolactate phosphatase [Humibacillus xanthopallidus]|uniref:2-phosphosulfolactate phosphatase n=1 Tax=Humibacillus xanthopallidus TaxID=412689 RepID=UPI003850671B
MSAPDGEVTTRPWHSQDAHVVRLEWGPTGAEALTRYAVASGAAVTAVVIDVLSFTTCVSVAADAGITVHPYRWKDASATAHAEQLGATLAVPRSQSRVAGGGDAAHEQAPISLSPKSIRESTGVTSLVLPSPNGSMISQVLADSGADVVAASLRNRDAVARWIVTQLVAAGRRPPAVVVVPAGERWPDGSLRPAVEDLWGAGAVIASLVGQLEHQAGPLLLSPEATAAMSAWRAVEGDVGAALSAAASGRELIAQGWPDDVAIAAELDTSSAVPVLRDGAYRPA